MLKQRFSLIAGMTALTLAAVPSLARADVPPATAGKDDAPTRLEFMVEARSLPPKLQDLPRGIDTAIAMRDSSPQGAIDKAAKAGRDLAALYPKCHFRIVSIAPPDEMTMRVTLLGEPGCLTAGK
jgi:hypothetical protein